MTHILFCFILNKKTAALKSFPVFLNFSFSLTLHTLGHLLLSVCYSQGVLTVSGCQLYGCVVLDNFSAFARTLKLSSSYSD